MIIPITSNDSTCENFIKCATQQEWSNKVLPVLIRKLSGKTEQWSNSYEMYKINVDPVEIAFVCT